MRPVQEGSSIDRSLAMVTQLSASPEVVQSSQRAILLEEITFACRDSVSSLTTIQVALECVY